MAVVVYPGLDRSEWELKCLFKWFAVYARLGTGVHSLNESISENQGEGVQDSGETGHAVWFRDSVTEEETGVRARGQDYKSQI
ncbi:hypothetical protein QTP70_002274 [Hemibagrus guttatus]|uniref:Uncharacterized protein n=1 Tax=Hemibagrus guttatus TaxID=175788 RepID=A0AAE0UP06_9TELE|nr:hypothetical protein QTP70_002274 [Hemibagrus guttatus]